MEDKKNTEEKEQTNKISEEEKQKMCALEYDIKNKGENSYYYAQYNRICSFLNRPLDFLFYCVLT